VLIVRYRDLLGLVFFFSNAVFVKRYNKILLLV
jgi:hypothetical protein